MRESEEYLEDRSILHDDYVNYVPKSDAEHAVKLSYKEGWTEGYADGYKEAIAKLEHKFKELQERHWMCTYKDVLYVIDNIDKEDE